MQLVKLQRVPEELRSYLGVGGPSEVPDSRLNWWVDVASGSWLEVEIQNPF